MVAEAANAAEANLTFPTWCAGEESNLHGPKPTGPSSQRVYHFATRAIRLSTVYSKDFLRFRKLLTYGYCSSNRKISYTGQVNAENLYSKLSANLLIGKLAKKI